MREIKFRGFNKKNGVWLYGFYLKNRGAHFILPDEFADGKGWDDYEVDPKSVGQFTGLKDCNGKDIYEGDLVFTAIGIIGVVKWNWKGFFFVDDDPKDLEKIRTPLGEMLVYCQVRIDESAYLYTP